MHPILSVTVFGKLKHAFTALGGGGGGPEREKVREA